MWGNQWHRRQGSRLQMRFSHARSGMAICWGAASGTDHFLCHPYPSALETKNSGHTPANTAANSRPTPSSCCPEANLVLVGITRKPGDLRTPARQV